MAYPKELVNLDRYPLDRPGSQVYRDLVQRGGGKLQADGILCLDGFLSKTGSVVLMEEAQSIEGLAYLQESDHTVYFADPDMAVPESHPRRRKVKTRKRSVARHLISGNGSMNALYEWPALRALVAELLGLETLYLHAEAVSRKWWKFEDGVISG